jgi:hypothetical protein
LNGEELKRSQKRIITIGETNLINKDSGGEREKPLQKKKKKRKKERKENNE